jgi:hypothetical protein
MKPVLTAALLCGVLCLSSCFRRDQVVVIPDINAAPGFVAARSLAFDGVPHPELSGSYSWAAGSVGAGKLPGARKRQWRYVIPVTSADWDRTRPVPLWMTFDLIAENQQSQIAAFAKAIQSGQVAGLNVDFPGRTVGVFRGVSAWQQAVADAEARYGIRSDPDAPIVSWRP